MLKNGPSIRLKELRESRLANTVKGALSKRYDPNFHIQFVLCATGSNLLILAFVDRFVGANTNEFLSGCFKGRAELQRLVCRATQAWSIIGRTERLRGDGVGSQQQGTATQCRQVGFIGHGRYISLRKRKYWGVSNAKPKDCSHEHGYLFSGCYGRGHLRREKRSSGPSGDPEAQDRLEQDVGIGSRRQ